jgi:hypothetical protein
MTLQENRMRAGNKKIFHLEAWIVKVMALYKVRVTVSLVSAVDSQSAQSFLLGFDMSEFD